LFFRHFRSQDSDGSFEAIRQSTVVGCGCSLFEFADDDFGFLQARLFLGCIQQLMTMTLNQVGVGGRSYGNGPLLISSRRTSSALLHYVGEFVREQLPALWSARRVLTHPKHQVTSNGKSQRVHGTSRLRGLCIGMYAYSAEIVTETHFHISSRRGVERLRCRTQAFFNRLRIIDIVSSVFAFESRDERKLRC